MKLLVTGGTGFFGRSILKFMATNPCLVDLSRYEKVVVVTRSPYKFKSQYPILAALPWLSLFQGDVTDANSLSPLLQEGPFDAILHAATDSTDSASLTATQQFDQIVIGTRNMLDLAVSTRVTRFLLTSSGGVYGPQPNDILEISEDYHGIPDPLLPSSTYGLAKRMAEHLCCLYQRRYGIETVIARCFAFVGEDLPVDAHFAIGNFIRDAIRKDAIYVKGNGSPIRSYMDQRDLALWLLTLLGQGSPGQAYNVGSDESISIKDLAYLVRDIIAPQKSVIILGEASADNISRNRYVPSIIKAKTDLRLQLSFSLSAAIRAASSKHFNAAA